MRRAAWPVVLAAVLLSPSASGQPSFAVHGWDEIGPLLAAWESDHPEWVNVSVAGASVEGRPLHLVRITEEGVAARDAQPTLLRKLRVLLDGGAHGDEYLSTEFVLAYLEGLLENATRGDASTLALLRSTEIVAVPLVNPDGHAAGRRKNANGVDLNRNYAEGWGGPGSGADASDHDYRGPGPLSEPETNVMVRLAAERPDVWVSAHAGAVAFVHPWSGRAEAAPDAELFRALAPVLENATGRSVRVVQRGPTDPASGGSDDYGYARWGVPSFVFEVHADKNVTTYPVPFAELLAPQLRGLDALVRNASRVGAWVEVEAAPGGLRVRNAGWGGAERVEVYLKDGNRTVGPLAAGAEAFVALGGAGPQNAAWIYRPLRINTSTDRVHLSLVAPPPPGAVGKTPGAAFATAALAVLLALILPRRPGPECESGGAEPCRGASRLRVLAAGVRPLTWVRPRMAGAALAGCCAGAS